MRIKFQRLICVSGASHGRLGPTLKPPYTFAVSFLAVATQLQICKLLLTPAASVNLDRLHCVNSQGQLLKSVKASVWVSMATLYSTK